MTDIQVRVQLSKTNKNGQIVRDLLYKRSVSCDLTNAEILERVDKLIDQLDKSPDQAPPPKL